MPGTRFSERYIRADTIVRKTEKMPRQYRYVYRYSIFWNTEKYRHKVPRFDFLEYMPEKYRKKIPTFLFAKSVQHCV